MMGYSRWDGVVTGNVNFTGGEFDQRFTGVNEQVSVSDGFVHRLISFTAIIAFCAPAVPGRRFRAHPEILILRSQEKVTVPRGEALCIRVPGELNLSMWPDWISRVY